MHPHIGISSIPPGTRMYFSMHETQFPPLRRPLWIPFDRYRSGGSAGPTSDWHVSLLYPTGVATGLLLYAVKLKRKPPVGRCLNCGYDLNTLPTQTCPECGHTEPTP